METVTLRIVLLVHALPGGGAGRVVTHMANYWANAGHHVTIMTLENSDYSFYPISASVKCRTLNLVGSSSSWVEGLLKNLRRVYLIRRVIIESAPDYLLSFIFSTNILVLLATRFLGIPVIVSERNHPDYSKENRFVWHRLRRILYPLANHLVVQSQEIREWFKGYNRSIHIIGNPVRVSQEEMESEPETQLPEGRHIVAMGQLIWQKGFNLLLDAFARVSNKNQDWNLIIVGTGIMKDELLQQVKKLGLEDSVFFPGCVRNPYAIFARCDIFVLSSRYEGFPNVLLEAMACGLPPVSFDCPSGPGEIIQQGSNGYLVPPENIKSMENTLCELMQDEELRINIGKEASKVRGRYAPDKIMKQWELLLK